MALLSFPSLLEPNVGIWAQGLVWGAGFFLLGILIAQCARKVSATGEVPLTAAEPEVPAPHATDRIRWTVLALIPSSLMLGVTSHFTIDIAAIPLFWILPLALYLLSFVMAFSNLPQIVLRLIRRAMAPAVIALLLVGAIDFDLSVRTALLLHLGVFFLVALALHCELARIRPAPRHLTSFYLWMSLGGMLGGLFNSLLAPFLFVTPIEYPLALALAIGALCLGIGSWHGKSARLAWAVELGLALGAVVFIVWINTPYARLLGWLTSRHPETVVFVLDALLCFGLMFFRRQLALCVATIVFVWVALAPSEGKGETVVVTRERNFFGAMEVNMSPLYVRIQGNDGTIRRVISNNSGALRLINGTTVHGMQYVIPNSRPNPVAYFHPMGPVGDIFATHDRAIAPEDVGVLGLGAGTIAAYGRPERRMSFFEIDDKVVRVATSIFSYLSSSRGPTRIVLGDARLKLEEEPDRSFGILFIDAFSSDAVPVHLLTREAVALYTRKVTPDGLIVMQLTNRHLDLSPIVARLASDLGLYAVWKSDDGNVDEDQFATCFAVLSRDPSSVAALLGRPGWNILTPSLAAPAPLWTDDFTSYYHILNFKTVMSD